MFIEFDENKIKEISDITLTDYEYKNGMLPVENLKNIIEDLIYEIDNLNSELEILNKDIEDNYVRRSLEDDYCISDKDFI